MLPGPGGMLPGPLRAQRRVEFDAQPRSVRAVLSRVLSTCSVSGAPRYFMHYVSVLINEIYKDNLMPSGA